MSFFTFLLFILEVSVTFFILTFIYPVSMDRNHSLSSPADEKVSPVPWQLGQKLSLITLYFTVRNIRHLYQLSSLVVCCFESLMWGQWCTRDTWSDISARGSCPVKTREWCGLLSAQQARPIIQTFDIPQHYKLQLHVSIKIPNDLALPDASIKKSHQQKCLHYNMCISNITYHRCNGMICKRINKNKCKY